MLARPALLLALCLATTAAFGRDPSAEFRAAYAAYREAIENGNRHEALMQAKRAFELGGELYGKEHATTAALGLNLGNALLASGRTKEAQRVLERTLRHYERLHGRDTPELIDVLIALGDTRNACNSRAQVHHYRRALAIARAHFGDPSDVVIALGARIGARLIDTGHLAAGPILAAALEQADELYGRRDPRTYWPKYHMARYQLARRRYGEAQRLLEDIVDALADRRETRGGAAELRARALLVEALEMQGKSAEATQHCVAIGASTPWSGERDPTPIYATKPKYGSWILVRKNGGYVVVEFRIDPSGFVSDPKVVERTGYRVLERQSLEALAHWRYAPKVVNGRAVWSEPVRAKLVFPAANDDLRHATLTNFD